MIFGKSNPGQQTPFAELLDGLYHLILSSIANIEKVMGVLMILVFQPFPGMWSNQQTTLIEEFLFYRPGEIDMIFIELHSIIYVPPPGNQFRGLRLFHASLPDFLLD